MLQKIKENKGFTLIELMVVIAIIAILATVVLVSLQSARDSAEDSNRISAVGQIRSLAEVYYAQSEDLVYDKLEDDPEPELTEVLAEYGDEDPHGGIGVLELHADGDQYCAAIQLKSDEDQYFCVDHRLTGARYSEAEMLCDGDNIMCEEIPTTD